MQLFLSKVLKASKKLWQELNKKPALLLSLGIFIFFLGFSRYYQIRVLSFTKTPDIVETANKGELPVEVIIPSIEIDHPLEIGSIDNGVWRISYDHPTFLESSAVPGRNGNVVIYGHNKKAIFGNLPYLSIGQKVIVKTQDNKLYTYEVYRKDFVGPDRVDLVSPTAYEELTLFTCWGLFDSQRAVVKARPI